MASRNPLFRCPRCRSLTPLLILLAGASSLTAQDPSELFFSEYVEGTSFNKALEIYNGTQVAVDLTSGAYDVQFFFSGSATAGATIALSGFVASGGTWVLADNDADPSILAVADQLSTVSFFNGDDAIVLRKAGAVIDSIGQVGFDPGSEWGTGETSTADNTLRRKVSVCAGDTNAGDPFDPATGWDGFPTDTFVGLGVHGVDCAGAILVDGFESGDTSAWSATVP